MWMDLRFVWRQILRNPAFSAVAILSLALGAGVNSAIFSLLDGLYLRPPAVEDSGNLVRVFVSSPEQPYGSLSYPEYEELRRESRSLRDLATLMRRGGRLELNGVRKLHLVNVTSPDFFQVLGVKPLAGRLYGPEEEGAAVAVLGFGAYQRLFGGDPQVVGRAVQLTDTQVTIIGVLPAEFRDLSATGDRDFWVPSGTWRQMNEGSGRDFTLRGNRIFETVGRLKAGVSLRKAQAELDGVAEGMEAVNGRRPKMAVVGDSEWRRKNAGVAGAALMAIVGLVVLTACVNVASLLLARAAARRREVGLRAALGAPKQAVARLFLLESLVLSVLGLAAGVAMAAWLVQGWKLLFPPPPGMGMGSGMEFRMDGRVFGATLTVSMLTVVLVGLAPMLTALRIGLMETLRGGEERIRRWPLRNVLAAAQVAMAVVMLTGAGLLGHSFLHTRSGGIGITRADPLVVWCTGERERYDEAAESVRALPGVRRVAVAMRAPFSLSGAGMFQLVSVEGTRSCGQNGPWR